MRCKMNLANKQAKREGGSHLPTSDLTHLFAKFIATQRAMAQCIADGVAALANIDDIACGPRLADNKLRLWRIQTICKESA